MVEILFDGRKDLTGKRIFSCGKCDTIFAVDEESCKNVNPLVYIKDGVIAECKCPICGSTTQIREFN